MDLTVLLETDKGIITIWATAVQYCTNAKSYETS